MKTFRVLALVAIVAIAAQALAVAPTARAQGGTIKVASHSPLSGGQSALGEAIRNGADLATQQLKANIEKAGFKIEFVPFDDQAKPEVGVANANNLVNDQAIMGVIGHLNSGVAIPSSEVYNKADLVMISPANTNVNITDRKLPTVNRVCGRDDAQAAVGVQVIIETLKAKTVYIVHDKTAYGEGIAAQVRDGLKAAKVDVLGYEGTTEKANFDAVITPIVAQKPDVIYFGGIYDQAAVFFKQARDKGVKAQFFGPDGMDSSELAKIGGDAVVGMIYTTAAGPVSIYPEAKKFVEDYKTAFKKNPEPYAVEAYASTQILLAGIEKAIKDAGGKLPTRKQVAAAVRGTKELPTLIGKITFDANGDPDYASYYNLSVKSADPTKWGENVLASTVKIASPLTMKALATKAATPAATAAK